MSRRKKQQKIKEIYTQVIPVASCSDETQVRRLIHLCGIPRALTYNLLGSLQGWGLDWSKADPIVRTQLSPTDIGLPGKLWEWSVNDAMKAILAQQEAAKTFIIRAIYRRTLDEEKRSKLLCLMHNDPTSAPWLHRVFRTQYQRGHTFVRNQIVYQGGGYTCKRLTRNTVKLEVQGLKKGKRIALKLKCRHIISGQNLASMGKSVTEALDLGWLSPKFRAQALQLEVEYHKCGVLGTVKLRWVGEVPGFINVPNDNHQRMKPAI